MKLNKKVVTITFLIVILIVSISIVTARRFNPDWTVTGDYLTATGEIIANYLTENPINLSNRAMADNCPQGQVAVNVTTGGIQCIALSIDPIYNVSTIYSKTNTTSITQWQLIPNFSLLLNRGTTYKVNCELRTETNLSTSGSQINVSYKGFGFNITQDCIDYPTPTSIFTFESNFTNSSVNSFACLSTGNPSNSIPKTIYYNAVIQTSANTELNVSLKCETGVCNVISDSLSFCRAEVIM